MLETLNTEGCINGGLNCSLHFFWGCHYSYLPRIRTVLRFRGDFYAFILFLFKLRHTFCTEATFHNRTNKM